MIRIVTLAMLLASATPLVAQTASSPTAAAASSTIRPGIYDLDVVYGGGVLQGTLTLTATGDSLTATLHVGAHDPPVRSLTRSGSRLTLNAGDAGMALVYTFDFKGDALTGTFTFNGDAGEVTGKRRS